MKTSLSFSILICMTSMLIISACEKMEIQNSSSKEEVKIESRADDCDDCPVEDCCCRITQTTSGLTGLVFCGTTNPELSSLVCGADLEDPCQDVSGFYWFSSLSGSGDDEFFCVQKNSTFMVGVNAASTITISCQYGQSTPQVVTKSLSAGEKLFFSADGDCELSECHAAD